MARKRSSKSWSRQRFSITLAVWYCSASSAKTRDFWALDGNRNRKSQTSCDFGALWPIDNNTSSMFFCNLVLEGLSTYPREEVKKIKANMSFKNYSGNTPTSSSQPHMLVDVLVADVLHERYPSRTPRPQSQTEEDHLVVHILPLAGRTQETLSEG